MEFHEQLRNCKLLCMTLLLELGALKLILRNRKETREEGKKENRRNETGRVENECKAGCDAVGGREHSTVLCTPHI
jgi:hypothetical protein